MIGSCGGLVDSAPRTEFRPSVQRSFESLNQNLEANVINYRKQIAEELERAKDREAYFLRAMRENVKNLREQRRQTAMLRDELEREAQPQAAE